MSVAGVLVLLLAAAIPLVRADNATSPSLVDPHALELPAVGFTELRVISPTVVELTFVSAPNESEAKPEPPPVTSAGDYEVTVNNERVPVQRVGFKRRVLYAPLRQRDLRVGNYVYIEFAEPLAIEPPTEWWRLTHPAELVGD